MAIRKRGEGCWQVTYRCSGEATPRTETYGSEEEARIRDLQIKMAKRSGTFVPPVRGEKRDVRRDRTLREFLQEYVQVYGTKKWGPSYYGTCESLIRNYIDPYLGEIPLKEITTKRLDQYYTKLLLEPAAEIPGHSEEARVSASTVHRVHRLLKSALGKAVGWEYLTRNPALYATLPTCHSNKRAVWSDEEALQALRCCENEVLETCMYLALGCSLRLGEILGLQWRNVHMTSQSIADGEANLRITQELKRVNNASMNALAEANRDCVLFRFPKVLPKKTTTTLVLKEPKTESSKRTVYLPRAVADNLIQVWKKQQEYRAYLGDEYQNFDLVVAQVNGRPFEQRMIDRLFAKLIQENGFSPCVFHSLRHCSTSLKLKLSQGNIKAVQGDTGHAEARMVTDTYAHGFDADRKSLAREMDEEFFSRVSAEGEGEVHEDRISRLKTIIQENPQLIRELLLELS